MNTHERRVAFGKTIRNDIQASHLPISVIADKTGITRQQLNLLMSGRSGTRRDTVESLAIALGVSISHYLELAGFVTDDPILKDIDWQSVLYIVPEEIRREFAESTRINARLFAKMRESA